jgi:hypothetical protein
MITFMMWKLTQKEGPVFAGELVVSVAVDARNGSAPAAPDEQGFVCAAVDPEIATGSGSSGGGGGGGGGAVLAEGQSYFLTLESKGCDTYFDDEAGVIHVAGAEAAAHVKSVYGTPPAVKLGGGGAGHCYGPLNFHYV